MSQGAAVDLLGLDPKLGRVEALVLVRYGYYAAEELVEPDFEPGVVVVGREVTAAREYGEKVLAATEQLDELDSRLAFQERATQKALKRKTEALEKLHARSRSVARILENLYVLAGERFHAERLRSSLRRTSSSVEAELEEGLGEEELETGKRRRRSTPS